MTSSGRGVEPSPNKFINTNSGQTTIGARESKSVNRTVALGGKKKLDPLTNALALEPLGGPSIQRFSRLK